MSPLQKGQKCHCDPDVVYWEKQSVDIVLNFKDCHGTKRFVDISFLEWTHKS